jgi:hypothetical protein
MRWQCALLQRWLPEYPDGDLPALGKRWLKSHVAHCSACRQELAGLKEVVAAVEAAPVADPRPEFWGEFSRDLHLKLVQTASEGQIAPLPPVHRWFRLPYLLGAPALAVLLLYLAVQLTGPGTPVQDQARVMRPAAPNMAASHQRTVPPAEVAAVPSVEEFVPVSLGVGPNLPPDETDLSGWDLDSELAGMTDQEKEVFLHQLHQREKDGSCGEKFSFCSWG